MNVGIIGEVQLAQRILRRVDFLRGCTFQQFSCFYRVQYQQPTVTVRRAAMMEKYGGRTNLEMDYFGGEPLMNWDVVKQLVEYARSVEKERGKNFCFTLTTNGRGFQYTGRVFRQKLVQAGMTQSMSRVLRVALTTIPWKASGIS